MDQNQIRRFPPVMHELCPDTALCEVFTVSILSDAVHGLTNKSSINHMP
jgi:hypothetical protein